MSIQQALDFIRSVENQSELRDAVREGYAENGLNGVVQIGAHHRFDFDEQQLRSAFGIDWTMRLLHTASRPGKSGRLSAAQS